MKKSVSRRTVLGLVSAAVVIGMTGVTTWALADDNSLSGPTVRLVVGVKHGADVAAPKRAVASMAGVRKAAAAVADKTLSAIDASTLEVSASQQAKVIARLKSDPNVDYVRVAQFAKAFDVAPNDPQFVAGNQPELDRLHVPTAWDTTTGSAVTVAVVDTGVTAVGDLAGAVLPGYDFANGDANPADDEGHGTEVSSIIAGRGNNGAGMAGDCWACNILPVKVLNSAGSGSDYDIASGIVYATDQGAKIINMSLGFPPGVDPPVVAKAVAYAFNKGALVVAAAGNEDTSVKVYPAAYPYVLAVGGTALDSDARIYFSNYGPWVDVAAPGCALAMDNRGLYTERDPDTGTEVAGPRCGTSFSSPLTAGVAALIKSANPSLTNWSLLNAVIRGARALPGNWTAFGMVDAAKALTVPPDTTKPTLTGFSPADKTKVHGVVTLTAYATDAVSGVRSADLYVDGKWTTNDTTSPYQLKYNTAGRNGTIPMQVRISDRAGNVTLINRNLIADNVLPAVSITSAPANNAKVSGKVTIKASASDANGVNRVELLINGKVIQTDKTSPYSFVITASKQPKKMKMQVRAIDQAGNIRYTPARNWTR